MSTPFVPPLACVFYANAKGKEPVREWLRHLPKEVRIAVGSDIQKVQWRWPVSRPLVGAMGEGMYEVRTSFRSNEYRVFFCVQENLMVLLHAFQKKTQKTPERELKLARNRGKEVAAS